IDETGKVNSHSYVTMGVQGINMHVGVWGSTRMGKTTLIMSLVGQFISKGINPILMVPSKGFEYDMLMHLFPDIRVFTCGRADVSNLVYNPWNPPDGVRLTKWVDRVVEVWTLWMPNERVISMHVDDVVYKVYEICNWDLEENKKGRPILLEDVVAAVNIVCESLPYGDEVNSNIKGALISRIKSILRKPSLVKMFNTRTGLTISELMAHPTIIRMDDLSENDKILVMGLLTAAVSEYKLANPSTQVTNILVLEEAHYLLGRSDLTGEANSAVRLQAVNALIEMLRVLGGTGLGVILVDQLPSELVPKAVKIPVNTVVFALTHEEDKELAGKRARCTDSQIDHISGMKVGEAVVFLQREGAPQNVMILPLDKLIGNEQPVDLTGDQAIRNHMQPIFDQYPELHSSEPLPDGLLNQLLTRKTDSSKQWFERISLEFRRQIEGTVQSRKFKEYCKKLIAKEDISALMKLIQKTSDVSGDGSYISSLYVLDQMVKCYRNPENQPVFDKMGLEVDEAKPT
ncbi:MAG: ATP-binding protein, partial [Candidatus Thorarchaeota archaeon]